VLRRGRRVAFAEGRLTDGAGQLLAVAQGTWHLEPHDPEVAAEEAARCVVLRGTRERLRVGKIVAVGRNYADHVREMGAPSSSPPVLFLKPPSAIVHDGGAVRIPPDAGAVHHEVELVAVLARSGRLIPEGQAIDHVLGFAVGLDMTLRDVQAAAKAKGEPWTIAKGFDTSAGVSEVALRGRWGTAPVSN